MLTLQEKLDKAKEENKTLFALLIDPDKLSLDNMDKYIQAIESTQPDLIFVGGSLIINDFFNSVLEKIKSTFSIPVVLFPGNNNQISSKAHAILLLSLISGRNPEWLIGQHVQASFALQKSGLEILPTGYLLIDGGRSTSVSYISNTSPIPSDKIDIALATALAGQQLGLKNIYLEAGSGALNPVSIKMIESVRKTVDIPLIIGGGMRSPEQVLAASKAGATVVVVGTAIEKDLSMLGKMIQVLK
jgi:putative glycerol-1-phosphate prenyltransferase